MRLWGPMRDAGDGLRVGTILKDDWCVGDFCDDDNSDDEDDDDEGAAGGCRAVGFGHEGFGIKEFQGKCDPY